MTRVELKERIRDYYDELPRNQKNLAEFFIDNFERIPFLSVHDISEDSSASTATVVRFAQRIGFSGFSELRDAIAGIIQNDLNQQVYPFIDNLDDDVLTSVANQDIQDINNTLNTLDRESFTTAIDAVMSANRIYTAGLGVSYLLSQILAYQLNQVGLDANPLRQGETSFLEQLLYASEDDLLMVLSYPPYSRETIDAAQFATERGIKVIAITDKPAAPVTFCSDNFLVVKSENMLYTNSFAAISVIINAISTECARRDKERIEKILRQQEEISQIRDDTIG